MLLSGDHIGDAMSRQQQTDVLAEKKGVPSCVDEWQNFMVRGGYHPSLNFVFSFILRHLFLIHKSSVVQTKIKEPGFPLK